jgi:hypothetical protein
LETALYPEVTVLAEIGVGKLVAAIVFEGNPIAITDVVSTKEAASVVAAGLGLASELLLNDTEPEPPKPFTRVPKLDVPPLLDGLLLLDAPAPPEAIVTVTVLGKSERIKMASAGGALLPPFAGCVVSDLAPPPPPPTTNTAHIVPEDGLVHVPDEVNV